MASQPAGKGQNQDHVALDLLKSAHAPDTANTIFNERVKLRPLLLRPTSPDPNRDARSKRQYERHQKAKAQRKSKKPKPLSAKQKRALCIYDIPTSQQKRTYVDALSAGPLLVSADYHGALVEVTRSRCVSRVGMKGIVVKDTKFTFEIVTRKDELKIMPKEHAVFKFEVPFEREQQQAEAGVEVAGVQGEDVKVKKPLVFEIHGSQFESRAPDRANKKFRLHLDPDL
ncbi:hypothetical protein LTR37_019259 [Vermiconidia calcicola]|uniref:Uncharacterized protein n=1 Tax=Vermiconidia calcicola TaxID=1690605 RepID=A0ACC3MEP9_9PEZI|nr:hypothetical protein LTR37_019259 [Vermiconidia calcicola]